jgi:pyridoxine kinase
VTEVLAAADAARAMGPSTVLVTSVVHDAAAEGTIDMIAVTDDGAWSVTTPLLPRTFTGAGDLTAATFLAHLLSSGSVATAVGRTAAVVYGVLKATVDSGHSELRLVAAQDEIASPSNSFDVTRLR